MITYVHVSNPSAPDFDVKVIDGYAYLSLVEGTDRLALSGNADSLANTLSALASMIRESARQVTS